MNEIALKLDERTAEGKKVAKLRDDGFVPSVVYGGAAAPISTQSQFVETTKAVKAAGKHSPVHLTIGGKKKLAIIKTIDMDPVKHTLRHVAFHTIRQNEKIVTEVPIVLVGEGESAAEKAGLIVLQAIEKVEIRALPGDLPESLEASIANLATHEDRLTLADIELPKGVEFADHDQDVELVVANVYEPSALQAANDASGGDAEDVDDVESENGSDTPQDNQTEETRPGGKSQDEPKQSNVDTNK
ncbi:MAG TPA: 50S ribosomal protein L25 [Candidatus Saccharimonadales bacterium]|nr:50S ribosomal protein L25 [Candidatus Saccharimonadales bacterium]